MYDKESLVFFTFLIIVFVLGMASLIRWATAHAAGGEALLHWSAPRMDLLTAKTATKQLQELETSHNIISSYLWLSMRLSTKS